MAAKQNGRFVTVEKQSNSGEVLTQEVHLEKWNQRSKPWQKAGWKLATDAKEPQGAKKADAGKSKGKAGKVNPKDEPQGDAETEDASE